MAYYIHKPIANFILHLFSALQGAYSEYWRFLVENSCLLHLENNAEESGKAETKNSKVASPNEMLKCSLQLRRNAESLGSSLDPLLIQKYWFVQL